MREIRITEDCIIYNDMEWGWVTGKGQPAWHKSIYNRWHNMWARCKDPENKSYENYKDCPIDDRYHLLSNYVNDVQLLDDFFLLKENPSKYSIDKDKKDPNNRCYYFEHLSIVTDSENSKERNDRCGSPFIEGKANPPKPAIGINITNGYILILESTYEGRLYDFDPSTISKCCRNTYGKKGNIYKGYRWEYLKEDDNEDS